MSYTANQEKSGINSSGQILSSGVADNAGLSHFTVSDPQDVDTPSIIASTASLGTGYAEFGAHGFYSRAFQTSNGSIGFFPNSASLAVTNPPLYFTNSSPYAFKTAGTTWGNPSDIALKENIREISNATEKLVALHPVHFDFKPISELSAPAGTRTGFIAQEFQEVLPGHVHEQTIKGPLADAIGKDSLLILEPDLLPYLVKSIQELKAEIDVLRAELAAVKG